jgi:hypothetical protein
LPRVLVSAFFRADRAGKLRDAIAHLGKAIPKSEHDMPAVLMAAEMLTGVAGALRPG